VESIVYRLQSSILFPNVSESVTLESRERIAYKTIIGHRSSLKPLFHYPNQTSKVKPDHAFPEGQGVWAPAVLSSTQ